jgi:pimeloyl-ACP methyl ester carboxylesterase
MEKVISKDGTPIAYLRQGDGPPLVLVHGSGVVAKNWMMVMPALAKHFTVFAMERRGRGDSGDNEPYGIEREYEDIAAVVDSIDQPVNLLGHSFGGILTLEAALLTNNVRKLLLYEPPLNLPDVQTIPTGLFAPIEKLINDGQKEKALTHFYELIGTPASEIDLMQTLPDWDERVASADTLLREIRVMERHVFDAGKFTKLQIRTTFLIGGDDQAFWQEILQVLNQALPVFSTDVLPGQGHFAMITAPDLFADALKRFFKD